jgi:hypothetical protein
MKIFLFTAIAIVSVGMSASHAAVYSLSGSMDPAQALTNPANTGGGSGTIVGDYDETTRLLNYTLTWAGLTTSITNMHFHNAPVGVSGGVDLGIPAPWTSPYVGSATLDAGQETNLLAGDWYANVHTADFGGGEIRGQVGVSRVPEPSVALLGTVALVSLALRRKR